jgi:hypothetical protein
LNARGKFKPSPLWKHVFITLHFGHWCGATSVRFPKEAIRNP